MNFTFNESILFEWKEEQIQQFKNLYGEDTFETFNNLQSKLKSKGFSTNIQDYLPTQKNPTPKLGQDDIDEMFAAVAGFITDEDGEKHKNAIQLAENKYYEVFVVQDYETSQNYGLGANWCTTGRYGHGRKWNPSESEGRHHYDNYLIRNYDFYTFVLPKFKSPNLQMFNFCAKKRENGWEIWNQQDKSFSWDPDNPPESIPANFYGLDLVPSFEYKGHYFEDPNEVSGLTVSPIAIRLPYLEELLEVVNNNDLYWLMPDEPSVISRKTLENFPCYGAKNKSQALAVRPDLSTIQFGVIPIMIFEEGSVADTSQPIKVGSKEFKFIDSTRAVCTTKFTDSGFYDVKTASNLAKEFRNTGECNCSFESSLIYKLFEKIMTNINNSLELSESLIMEKKKKTKSSLPITGINPDPCSPEALSMFNKGTGLSSDNGESCEGCAVSESFDDGHYYNGRKYSNCVEMTSMPEAEEYAIDNDISDWVFVSKDANNEYGDDRNAQYMLYNEGYVRHSIFEELDDIDDEDIENQDEFKTEIIFEEVPIEIEDNYWDFSEESSSCDWINCTLETDINDEYLIPDTDISIGDKCILANDIVELLTEVIPEREPGQYVIYGEAHLYFGIDGDKAFYNADKSHLDKFDIKLLNHNEEY